MTVSSLQLRLSAQLGSAARLTHWLGGLKERWSWIKMMNAAFCRASHVSARAGSRSVLRCTVSSAKCKGLVANIPDSR